MLKMLDWYSWKGGFQRAERQLDHASRRSELEYLAGDVIELLAFQSVIFLRGFLDDSQADPEPRTRYLP